MAIFGGHSTWSKTCRGFPWWLSGEESIFQCRRQSFIPWSGKIPHAAEQLNPCAILLKPVHPRPHVPRQDKPPQREACPLQLESGSCLPQVEKSLKEDPTNTAEGCSQSLSPTPLLYSNFEIDQVQRHFLPTALQEWSCYCTILSSGRHWEWLLWLLF